MIRPARFDSKIPAVFSSDFQGLADRSANALPSGRYLAKVELSGSVINPTVMSKVEVPSPLHKHRCFDS
jgi:hypothetical protein